MRRFLEKIFKIRQSVDKKRAARLENISKNEVFIKEAREQLEILARKGLSIPVFTL